jgi:hypothetical protein
MRSSNNAGDGPAGVEREGVVRVNPVPTFYGQRHSLHPSFSGGGSKIWRGLFSV